MNKKNHVILYYVAKNESVLSLVNKIKELGIFQKVVALKDLDEVKKHTVNVLLIDEDERDINKILRARDSIIAGIPKVYYVPTQKYTYLHVNNGVLQVKGITLIPLNFALTEENAVKRITQDVFEEITTKSNTFTFIGVDSKVGTTTIALSVARALSENTDKTVLYLNLSGSRGDEYVKDSGNVTYFENLIPDLVSGYLNEDSIKPLILQMGKLNIIKGMSSVGLKRKLQVEHLQTLFKLLEDMYNIVIIDAGSLRNLDLEYPFTLAPLIHSSNRFLITDQHITTFEMFKDYEAQVLSKVKVSEFMLIINKYRRDDFLLSSSKLANKYAALYLSEIPFIEDGIKFYENKNCLYDAQDIKTKRGLELILDYFTEVTVSKKFVLTFKKSLFKK